MSEPLAVVALGGNALLLEGERGTYEEQQRNARVTCEAIVPLVKAGWRIVVTHGNGPQVGNLLLKNEAARDGVPPMPLDLLVADTQGAIGYQIQTALGNALRKAGIEREIVPVVCPVVVDPKDPAFGRPTKPIGPFYTKERGEALRAEGWAMVDDAGRGWRRVVPSPLPRDIPQSDLIKKLALFGAIVVAVGGGGIPVVRNRKGFLEGVEAVIDKDRASARLAVQIGADRFVILTGVPSVCVDFGKPDERRLDVMTVAEARRYIADKQFAVGSMLPKVESAIDYIEGGGREALITDAPSLRAALKGKAGTRVVSSTFALLATERPKGRKSR